MSSRLPNSTTDNSIIGYVLTPEPMCFPHPVHFLNGDALCLGQEEGNKDGHDRNKPSKEEEETELHVAEHSKENLSNDEGEEHVH